MGEIVTTFPMIEGVSIYPLKQIGDERGMVMHMLRSDSPFFVGFGEAYFSTVKKGLVKGWKRHRLMIQTFAIPYGEIKFVIWDDRSDSTTKDLIQEIQVGVRKYGLVRIPSMVWYSFQGIGDTSESIIANVASVPYDPMEVEILPIDSVNIPYRWKL